MHITDFHIVKRKQTKTVNRVTERTFPQTFNRHIMTRLSHQPQMLQFSSVQMTQHHKDLPCHYSDSVRRLHTELILITRMMSVTVCWALCEIETKFTSTVRSRAVEVSFPNSRICRVYSPSLLQPRKKKQKCFCILSEVPLYIPQTSTLRAPKEFNYYEFLIRLYLYLQIGLPVPIHMSYRCACWTACVQMCLTSEKYSRAPQKPQGGAAIKGNAPRSRSAQTRPAWVSITIHQTCETDVWQHEQAVVSVFVRCNCSPQRRRARYLKGKEICLFLAAVPGSGRIDRIKLQVWNTFESLSYFSVTQCDVERAEFIWERGNLLLREYQINTFSFLSFSPHHSPSPVLIFKLQRYKYNGHFRPTMGWLNLHELRCDRSVCHRVPC